MLPSRTFSVSIDHDAQALYAGIWRPEFFPKWASGLAQSDLREDGERWLADGADGPIRIRFTPQNAHGIMDHWVDMGAGDEVYVPLRIIANGEGSEVLLTLFRQPGMDEERFSADAKLVTRDLKALKALIEA